MYKLCIAEDNMEVLGTSQKACILLWNEQGNSDTSPGRKPGAIGKNWVRGKISLYLESSRSH